MYYVTNCRMKNQTDEVSNCPSLILHHCCIQCFRCWDGLHQTGLVLWDVSLLPEKKSLASWFWPNYNNSATLDFPERAGNFPSKTLPFRGPGRVRSFHFLGISSSVTIYPSWDVLNSTWPTKTAPRAQLILPQFHVPTKAAVTFCQIS